MTAACPRPPRPLATPWLGLASALVAVPVALAAQAPPPTPPAEWGPVSIDMAEVEYPHPVEFLTLRNFGQDVRIAYMDVAPVGEPNRRTVLIPGVGHNPHEEVPEVVNAELIRFLGTDPVRPGPDRTQ